MPFRHPAHMLDLLWRERRQNDEIDRRAREAVKGALSKREVAKRLYPNATFWREK